jgi:hypothetical protein
MTRHCFPARRRRAYELVSGGLTLFAFGLGGIAKLSIGSGGDRTPQRREPGNSPNHLGSLDSGDDAFRQFITAIVVMVRIVVRRECLL